MSVRKIANVNSYLDDDDDADVDLVVTEDEDEFSPRSSSIQSGWEASQRLFSSSSGSAEKKSAGAVREFKFTEEPQIVKFLDADPIPFVSHWVNSRSSGRKSFICVDPDGSKKNCPLCKVHFKETAEISKGNLKSHTVDRKAKSAFNVVVVGDEEGPRVLFLEAGKRLYDQLAKLHADPKYGPLPKIFWSLSRTGTSFDTVHHITPVKPRDLAEDWDMDPLEFIGSIADLKPLKNKDLRHSTVEELQEIVDEISS